MSDRPTGQLHISGWDVSNPPEVERAFRTGYRIGASRCARCDLATAEAFTERLLDVAKTIKPGDPLEPRTQFGAMVSSEQMQTALQLTAA